MKEILIKAAQRGQDFGAGNADTVKYDTIDDMIEAEFQTDGDGWVKCSDRLPYKDGNSSIYCLVNTKHDGIAVRPYNEYHICWDQEDADDYYTDAVSGDITHWQPLPSKPKQLKR